MGNDLMHCDEHALLVNTMQRVERKLDTQASALNQELKEARNERQSITGKMNRIENTVVRIEARAEGRTEATGEVMAKANQFSGKMKWVVALVAAALVATNIVIALIK